MSYREFFKTLAYLEEAPPEGDRIDYAGAQLTTTLVNIHRGKRQPKRITSFMPPWYKQRPRVIDVGQDLAVVAAKKMFGLA